MDLLPGQNTVISASQIEVRLTYTQKTTFRSDLDASAFLLGENDKTHSDEDMLFFNNNSNANKSVTMRSEQGDTFFAVDLTTLPSSVSKIALTVVIDGPDTLDGLEQLKMTVDGHTFNVSLQGRSEKALIVAHIYRHNGQFKIRAVGQGFDGGLHPLALHFGVDVASPEPAPSSAPVPASNTTVSLEKKLAKAPALVSLGETHTRQPGKASSLRRKSPGCLCTGCIRVNDRAVQERQCAESFRKDCSSGCPVR